MGAGRHRPGGVATWPRGRSVVEPGPIAGVRAARGATRSGLQGSTAPGNPPFRRRTVALKLAFLIE
jgi:hypothetical protein